MLWPESADEVVSRSTAVYCPACEEIETQPLTSWEDEEHHSDGSRFVRQIHECRSCGRVLRHRSVSFHERRKFQRLEFAWKDEETAPQTDWGLVILKAICGFVAFCIVAHLLCGCAIHTRTAAGGEFHAQAFCNTESTTLEETYSEHVAGDPLAVFVAGIAGVLKDTVLPIFVVTTKDGATKLLSTPATAADNLTTTTK
jgi:hypothetical protein